MQTLGFIVKSVSALFYAGWIIYVLKSYESFTPHCYDPYPSFSLAIFAVIVCFTLPAAFLAVVAVVLLTIFSPCLIYQFCAHRAEQNRLNETREGVI